MSTTPTRRRRGANAIEFALIMPVMVGLVSAVLDYGYLFAVRFGVGAAAEEGARVGSLTVDPLDPIGPAKAAAEAKWGSLGLLSEPVFTVTREGDPELIVVRADVDPLSLVGLVPMSSFHATAVRRREAP
jgi:TadE-like protein